MSKETGGSAFPLPGDKYNNPIVGITTRDYFATQAMQGICAHQDTWGIPTSEGIAKAAYELADAMILERDK